VEKEINNDPIAFIRKESFLQKHESFQSMEDRGGQKMKAVDEEDDEDEEFESCNQNYLTNTLKSGSQN
jgi:hypothetical protein